MGCWCGEEGAWTRVVKPVTEEGKEGVNDRRFLSWTSGGCLHFLKYGTVVGWGGILHASWVCGPSASREGLLGSANPACIEGCRPSSHCWAFSLQSSARAWFRQLIPTVQVAPPQVATVQVAEAIHSLLSTTVPSPVLIPMPRPHTDPPRVLAT